MVAAAIASAANALSGVLIVQEMVPNDELGDPNIAVTNMLAGQFEKEGILAPVAWSNADPIFRAAINEGIVKKPSEVPSIAAASDVAKKLKLEYVIFIRTYQRGGNVLGRIQLFKNGKLVWKDPEKATEVLKSDQDIKPTVTKDKKGNVTKVFKPETTKLEDRMIAINGPDGLMLDDCAASLIRTWTEFLKTGPLKGQTFSPRINTPNASPGLQPDVPSEATTIKAPQVDNKQLLQDLDVLIKSGQGIQAVLILRDAVDVAPQDLERRMALVRTLLLVGEPELAAKEARRAAELLPDKVELRAMAARAWMQAGREDEAMADLNEAVARDPNSRETRMLLAEVNLAKGRPQQALEHLDALIKDKPTADAWFRHALCNALLGQKDAVLADLAKATELGLATAPQDAAARYTEVVEVLDRKVTVLGNDLRTLHQRARVRRTDPEVKQIADDLKAVVNACLAMVSNVQAPRIHQSSHERRILALNLLIQSLTDLSGFIATNDEDALAEAQINLGEALKHYANAQSAFKEEIGGTAKSVGTE